VECSGTPEERLEYQWASMAAELAPADHRLTVLCPASTNPARFLQPGPECDSALDRARGWPVTWTVETWPVILKPDSPIGRRLAVQQLLPGLTMIESGLDASGRPVIEHHVTIRADAAVAAETLDRLSIFRATPPSN
jgi:hypothetical protein